PLPQAQRAGARCNPRRLPRAAQRAGGAAGDPARAASAHRRRGRAAMSRTDLVSLLPELILCGGGVLILLLDAVAPGLRRAWTAVALAVTATAAWGSSAAWRSLGGGAGDPSFVWKSCNGMLETTRVTFAFSAVVLVATGLCVLASDNYLRRERILGGEYYALLLWCATGMLLMLRATEL